MTFNKNQKGKEKKMESFIIDHYIFFTSAGAVVGLLALLISYIKEDRNKY